MDDASVRDREGAAEALVRKIPDVRREDRAQARSTAVRRAPVAAMPPSGLRLPRISTVSGAMPRRFTSAAKFLAASRVSALTLKSMTMPASR